MSPEEFLRAKRANDRVGLSLVGLFVVWLPVYLWGVRPVLNAWLFQYIKFYPAMLHIFPIFAPLVLAGWLLKNKYPAPKASEVDSQQGAPADVSASASLRQKRG